MHLRVKSIRGKDRNGNSLAITNNTALEKVGGLNFPTGIAPGKLLVANNPQLSHLAPLQAIGWEGGVDIRQHGTASALKCDSIKCLSSFTVAPTTAPTHAPTQCAVG